MNWLKCILRVCGTELRKTFQDEGVLLFFIVVPFLYPLLYSYLYSRETVREVPVAVVDDSRTALSREFLRKANATPDINILSYCGDMLQARELINSHKVYGVIHIPAEFTKTLAKGEKATINLFCDMSGLLYYKALLSSCTEVSLSMNKNIKMERMAGLSQRELEVTAMPVEYDYVPLFNPQSGFGSFIIPALLIMILQQTMVLGVSMMAGTERERRRKGLLKLGDEYSSPMDVLLGKGLAYFLIYTILSVYMLCFVPLFFDFIQIWSPKDLILFMFPFVLACVFFSMTISMFVRERESCFLLFVFISVPMIFMSGISWPGSNIPQFWKWVSYLIPSTFGINGFAKMTNSGALLCDVMTEHLALWGQTLLYFMTALLIYIRSYRPAPGKGLKA